MNKIAFILPYFGKFNNYFQLFLYSCGHNRDICDWFVFTDDDTQYDYPSNVIVNYMTWENMIDLLDYKMSKQNCSIKIEAPYKLCDYKPLYGYIFEEYLKDYEFWGECDCDLLWGKMSNFINEKIFESFDKIFDLGHCTIYRNNEKINMLFTYPVKGKRRFIEVFEDPCNHSFDEEYNGSINEIAVAHRIRMFDESFAANIYTKSSIFRLTTLAEDKTHYLIEGKTNGFFIWENGNLYRYIKSDQVIEKKEYMYIHLQSRPMKVNVPLDGEIEVIKIIPNSFDELETDEINEDTFKRIVKRHFNLHYFKLRSKNLLIKMKRWYK